MRRLHRTFLLTFPVALWLGCAAPPKPAAPPVVIAAAKPNADAEALEEAAETQVALDLALAELRGATPEAWGGKVEAIRDHFGGPGLVRALDTVAAEPEEKAFFQTKHIFDNLESLADPRAADGIFAWVETKKPSMHWQGVAGQRLAEIGDIRAAKMLGERLKHEPDELYDPEKFWQADQGGHLSRTDLPRVASARLLSDLAVMHPEKIAELRAAAEEGVLSWMSSRPQPHANALRFLAAVRSTKVLPDLRDWAFPKDPLPMPGASPPFPAAYETAQMALRYLGAIHDEPSFPKLLAVLQRKDPKLDITQDALVSTPNAMLGMALRAIGYGASQGLSHFADPRAAKPLMTFIEDETWHEEARFEAASALAWCADEQTRAGIVPRMKVFLSKGGPKAELVATLYAQVFTERAVAADAPALVELVSNGVPEDIRHYAAWALATIAIDSAAQSKLEAKLTDKALREDAAFALLFGGATPVARLLGVFDGFDADEKAVFTRGLLSVPSRIVDEDVLAKVIRWSTRADDCAEVTLRGQRQSWVRDVLVQSFSTLRFDNGPHSVTRPVLRYRLYRAAQGDAATRRGAIAVLGAMKERGTLMALGVRR